MREWRDVFSNDVMASADMTHREVFGGVGLEVESDDLAERFGLKEVKIEKATWGSYDKLYIKRLNTMLEEEGQHDRIDSF
jgi:hypothetical protein